MSEDDDKVKSDHARTLQELTELADVICKGLKVALQEGENPFFWLGLGDSDEKWLAQRDSLSLLAKAGLIESRVRLEISIAVRITAPPLPASYKVYLQSPEWVARAEDAKRRAGQRCQGCNASRDDVTLDAHHRTYERIGHECPTDLTVLCRRCHQAIHESGGLAR
jgi:hypothetical protein